MKKLFSKSNSILIIIVTLAAILRLYDLSSFPAGFNADEAAIGYNAYSLLQTGKDEYGTSWPLVFKSFGDYKPGLYFYFVIPFVRFLGLNELAVRLPSALFGIGAVILVYFLAKEIFKNKVIGLLSSLILAITPWAVHFSRGGWETNVATFFVTLGILLFIKSLTNLKLILWSFVSFLFSMYIYQSPRLVVPILLTVLFVLYRRLLIKNKLLIFKKALLVIVLAIPLMFQFINGEGSARFAGLSFLSDPGPISRVNELRGEHINPNSLFANLIHNKVTAYGPEFLGHYLDHFKPDFLFINGDPIIRDKVPETGQFYIIFSLFLAVGLITLLRNNYQYSNILISWVLIAPLASSITFQTPNAVRSLNMVVPLTIVMSYGLYSILGWFNGKARILIVGIVGAIILFEFIHYLESYYVHYPKRYPLAWEYGFKEMSSKLSNYEPYYNKIVITDRYDQPYVLMLFYKKYDPEKYQPQAQLSPRDKFNFGTIRGFDKYEFRKIEWGQDSKTKDTLFIGTSEEIPENAKIIDRVNFPNSQPAFIFAQSQE